MDNQSVHYTWNGDLHRSRLTVFFRPILMIPHLVWSYIYTIGALVAVFLAWWAALFTGRVPAGLHRFIVGYLRYHAQLAAYQFLLANPFPPFGASDDYPVTFVMPGDPARQSRWTVFFRYLLAIPMIIASAVMILLAEITTVIAWFAIMFVGRIPGGLQRFGLGALQLGMRLNAYAYLATGAYPKFGPAPETVGARSE